MITGGSYVYKLMVKFLEAPKLCVCVCVCVCVHILKYWWFETKAFGINKTIYLKKIHSRCFFLFPPLLYQNYTFALISPAGLNVRERLERLACTLGWRSYFPSKSMIQSFNPETPYGEDFPTSEYVNEAWIYQPRAFWIPSIPIGLLHGFIPKSNGSFSSQKQWVNYTCHAFSHTIKSQLQLL